MDGVGVDTVNEALATIEGLLKPVYLSTVQELVVRQCWQGMSYEEIAESSGYDPDYLRGVGARLWQILSNAVGDRISKTFGLCCGSILQSGLRNPKHPHP
jgi:hypothetical protein